MILIRKYFENIKEASTVLCSVVSAREAVRALALPVRLQQNNRTGQEQCRTTEQSKQGVPLSSDLRNQVISFIVIFKTTKDKMPVRVTDFASLQEFAEWLQNVPKWAGRC